MGLRWRGPVTVRGALEKNLKGPLDAGEEEEGRETMKPAGKIGGKRRIGEMEGEM